MIGLLTIGRLELLRLAESRGWPALVVDGRPIHAGERDWRRRAWPYASERRAAYRALLALPDTKEP